MERTFENALVETEKFIALFVTSAFKMVVFMMIAGLIFVFVFGKGTSKRLKKIAIIYIPEFILLMFKFILSLVVMFYAFFYDFTLKTFIFAVADKMPLTTLFVGVLAAYEMFSSVFAILKIFIDILHKE